MSSFCSNTHFNLTKVKPVCNKYTNLSKPDQQIDALGMKMKDIDGEGGRNNPAYQFALSLPNNLNKA